MFTRKRSRHLAAAAGTLVLGTLLGGCTVYPHHAYYSGAVVVGSAPPHARVEIIGVAPWPGAVWIGGHWVWRDRWVWQRGYWSRPPHTGARWAPGRWTRQSPSHWRWEPGRWH